MKAFLRTVTWTNDSSNKVRARAWGERPDERSEESCESSFLRGYSADCGAAR